MKKYSKLPEHNIGTSMKNFTLAILLTASLPALAVPVSECFVTLGSFDGAYPLIVEPPGNFGLERVSGGPNFEVMSDKTNILLRLNKQREVLELSRYNQAGEVVKIEDSPEVPVQLSADCKNDRYNPVHLVCSPNEQKRIKAAAEKLLEQMPLAEACSKAQHRVVRFTQVEMIADLQASYLSAAEPQDMAEEYCRMKGYDNVVGFKKAKLQHAMAFGSFTAKTIRMSLSPKVVKKMSSFEPEPSPDWGVDVFTSIDCQRGERAGETVAGTSVVDTNEKSEPAGPPVPASGGSGAARAE
jgi:hypothetical protein